jgi:hypothetical protein
VICGVRRRYYLAIFCEGISSAVLVHANGRGASSNSPSIRGVAVPIGWTNRWPCLLQHDREPAPTADEWYGMGTLPEVAARLDEARRTLSEAVESRARSARRLNRAPARRGGG